MYQDNREATGKVEENRRKLEDRHPIVDLGTMLMKSKLYVEFMLDKLYL
ncbi:MAG TPA: hypothetical protein P5280_00180 [Cyclobacteriaceae bacterium]|nr:hypothetical protein [Cyclobacteriaceae bacterium]